MSAVDALRDGDVERALVELQDEVRKSPDEPRHRIFLFQLLSVLGQWERALTQLQVVRDLDPAAIAMVRSYETVLQCEALRGQVFAGEKSPLILGDPDPWIAELVEALRLSARGDAEAALRLREHAFEEAPVSSGTLKSAGDPQSGGGESEDPFEWIADADSRLGPVLEAIVNGRYYWVPFHRIKLVIIDPPTDLRDVVWLPAQFVWVNEGEAVGMIPTRYTGSEQCDDGNLRLARRTEWHEPIAGVYEGLGQRLLATDAGEYAIMNVRQLRFGEAAT
jgi:type VI secretion system protein ImpE